MIGVIISFIISLTVAKVINDATALYGDVLLLL